MLLRLLRPSTVLLTPVTTVMKRSRACQELTEDRPNSPVYNTLPPETRPEAKRIDRCLC